MSGTCVLRDYAMLADGVRGALIDPRGEIALDVLSEMALRRDLLDDDRRPRPLLGHSHRHLCLGRSLRGRKSGLECGLTLNHRLS